MVHFPTSPIPHHSVWWLRSNLRASSCTVQSRGGSESMGASSSSSKSPAWYPGEPSANNVACYYGDASSQPPLLVGSHDGSQLSITVEGKRALTTITTTAPPPAAREPAADTVGISPANPSSADMFATDLTAQGKRVERNINTLPVFELAGMKVGGCREQ